VFSGVRGRLEVYTANNDFDPLQDRPEAHRLRPWIHSIAPMNDWQLIFLQIRTGTGPFQVLTLVNLFCWTEMQTIPTSDPENDCMDQRPVCVYFTLFTGTLWWKVVPAFHLLSNGEGIVEID